LSGKQEEGTRIPNFNFSVNAENLVAHVQAGIYGPQLNQELKKFGLTLRHFPQSWEFSTVGGWVATLSGGKFFIFS
jgi:alkyldihydroxyacetonephosphate synthase